MTLPSGFYEFASVFFIFLDELKDFEVFLVKAELFVLVLMYYT